VAYLTGLTPEPVVGQKSIMKAKTKQQNEILKSEYLRDMEAKKEQELQDI